MGTGIRYSESFSMCQREAYTILRFETDPTFRFVHNNLIDAKHGKIPAKSIVIIPGNDDIYVIDGTLRGNAVDIILAAYKKYSNGKAIILVNLPVTCNAEGFEFEYITNYLRDRLCSKDKFAMKFNLTNLNSIGCSVINDLMVMDESIREVVANRSNKTDAKVNRGPTRVKIKNASDMSANKMEIEHEEEVENPRVVECKNPHNNCLDCDTYNECWMRYMPDIAPSFDINEKLKWDLVSLIDSIGREYQRDEEEAKNIEDAVDKVLEDGLRTADIAHGKEFIGTKEMTDEILRRI